MHKITFIIFYLLLSGSIVFSQILPFRNYTIKNGLPSNTISTIMQDSKGYIWIGTFDGVCRYDGKSFHNYKKQLNPGGFVVISIIESKINPGRFFVGTIKGGITMIDEKTGLKNISSSKLAESIPSSIVEDKRGVLWCAILGALVRTSNGNIIDTLLTFSNDIDAHIVNFDSLIAAGVGNVIHFYSINGKETNKIILAKSSVILSLYADNKKNLWVTTADNMLIEIHGNQQIKKCRLPMTSGSLCIDPDGFIWLSSTRGLMKLPYIGWENASPVIYGLENGLPDLNIFCVYIDREKNLWAGTWNKGLIKLSDKTTLKFHVQGEPYPLAMALDNSGNVWNSDPPNGIREFYKDSFNEWKFKLHKLDLKTSSLNGQIISGKENLMWIALTDGSLDVFKIHHNHDMPSDLEKKFQIRILPRGETFSCIYLDPLKRLWCSALTNDSVLVYDISGKPRLVKTLIFKKDIFVSSVRVIDSDKKGNIWLGGFDNGLDRISPDWKITHFTTDNGLSDNNIRTLAVDDKDRVWIGTRYGGISIFDGSNFTNISTSEGLLSNVIWSISYDGYQKMWLGTSLGSMWVSTADIKKMGWYNSITGDQMLTSMADNKHNFWGRTAEDIIYSDYGKMIKNNTPPPVYISYLTVNGNEIKDFTTTSKVPYDKNTWAISYVGLSFVDENSVRFQYRLVGSSDEWSESTTERSVTFAALKPGNYRFEVKAINNDGIQSLQPAELQFIILPPFWLQWWFLLLITFIVCGTIILFIYQRFGRLKEEKQRQTKFSQLLIELQEKERKRIASELHDGLGQNLLIIKNLASMGNTFQDQKQYLDDISDIAGRSVAEVREIAHNLRPHLLDKLGLTKCLRNIIHQTAESSNISISENICLLENLFSPQEEMNIYRIIQEGLNNIIKHSGATNASVSITLKNLQIIILISDNGNGFVVSTDRLSPPSQSGEYGILTMSERLQMLNGSLNIVSAPGKGTKIIAKIPITQKRSD